MSASTGLLAGIACLGYVALALTMTQPGHASAQTPERGVAGQAGNATIAPADDRAQVLVPMLAVRAPQVSAQHGKPADVAVRSPVSTADPDWRRRVLAELRQAPVFVDVEESWNTQLMRQRGQESRAIAGLTAQPALKPGTTVLSGQTTFPSAPVAASALVNALRTMDMKSISRILGERGEAILSSGEANADRQQIRRFLAAYQSQHSIEQGSDGRMELHVGPNSWVLPIPLMHSGKQWWFDTRAGEQELLDRRIGRNEFTAIRVLLACVDAEHQYFARMRAIAGSGFYATRILSTPGRRNGLFWPVMADQQESPLAALIAEARNAGYPGGHLVNGRPIPYQGYYFRILKEQGPQAPGGARRYLRDGKMSEGFAFIAWPAAYGTSGVMSFLGGSDGSVFQKNLGSNSSQIGTELLQFDPDPSWSKIIVK